MSKGSTDWPLWVRWLFKLIGKHWHYEGACSDIQVAVNFLPDRSTWAIIASPVFQEYYGGQSDGERYCNNFVFGTSDFTKESGLWVQDFDVWSSRNGLRPGILFKGKFRGHKVGVTIALEPEDGSEPVTLFDTITKEVRPINAEGETP